MFNVKNFMERVENREPVAVDLKCHIYKVDNDQHLVTGVVYSPYVLDTHDHYMTADEVRKMAHAFIQNGLQSQIDVMHDNQPIDATIVESYITTEDSEHAPAGSWIATTKINDSDIWNAIKTGKLNGYSFEAMVYSFEHEAEIEYDSWEFGETQPDPEDGHTHFYLVKMDDTGNVAYGYTGKGGEDGHTHTIRNLSVTELSGNHTHRIIL